MEMILPIEDVAMLHWRIQEMNILFNCSPSAPGVEDWYTTVKMSLAIYP